MIPIYINCRDRVSTLRTLVTWLEDAGEERIVLMDNDSTWEPLLEYLAASPHEVVRFCANLGTKALWSTEMVPNEPFVLTDPDVLPIEDCPTDLVPHLQECLDRYPLFPKAGPGLYLDDVPPDLESLGWEETLVSPERQLEPGVYDSLIDTTFALYRAGSAFGYYSLRLGFPYQTRHMSWYVKELDDENRHYLARAIRGPEGSSWAVQEDAKGT